MDSIVIFVFLAVAAVTLQSSNADVCTQQLDSFRTCVRGQMAKDTSDPSASESRRQQMENELSTCATSYGCRDPLPLDSERQAREACFSESRNDIRQRLQWCVQQQFSDIQLPGDDNDKDAYWNFVLLRSFAVMKSVGDNSRNRNRNNKQQWQKFGGNQPSNDICANDDTKKNNVVTCLKTKGTFNKTSSNSNWRKNSCKIKRQCNQVTSQCQQQWDQNTKPKICDCVNTLKKNGTMKSIQDNYVQCLKTRGVANVDQNNDDGRVVVQKMLTNWCASGKLNKTQLAQADPCTRPRKGQNGNNGASSGASNGASSSNTAVSSSSNTAVSSSSNTGVSSSSNTAVSSSSNTGVSSNTNVQTSSADVPYDDGTLASAADINPVSGMLGGTDILSQLTGSTSSAVPASGLGSGGLLGSLGSGGLLSSLGGGGLLSSLTGGASPFGGDLLSAGTSLLGGADFLATLFGGVTPSDLFASLAPPVDPTALTSSMGAFGGGNDLFSGFGGDSGNLLGSIPTVGI